MLQQSLHIVVTMLPSLSQITHDFGTGARYVAPNRVVMTRCNTATVHADLSRSATRRLAALGLLPLRFSARFAEFPKRSGPASKRILLENSMRYLSTALFREITRQVLATGPLVSGRWVSGRSQTHPAVCMQKPRCIAGSRRTLLQDDAGLLDRCHRILMRLAHSI